MRVLGIIHVLVIATMAAMYASGPETAGGQTMRQALGLLGFAPAVAYAQGSGLTTGEGQGDIRLIVIGLDLSKSNPLVSDDVYARKVADRVAGMVAKLGFRGRVMVRTFGDYAKGSNAFHFDATVSSRYQPDQLAADIELLIASTPALVRKGTWSAQGKTNIVGFLENLAEVIECSEMPTTIVLASDGLEDSEYARLRNANATLPSPDAGLFAGCNRLEILGIGRAAGSPVTTKRLRETWASWAQAAGFADFAGLNDW